MIITGTIPQYVIMKQCNKWYILYGIIKIYYSYRLIHDNIGSITYMWFIIRHAKYCCEEITTITVYSEFPTMLTLLDHIKKWTIVTIICVDINIHEAVMFKMSVLLPWWCLMCALLSMRCYCTEYKNNSILSSTPIWCLRPGEERAWLYNIYC